ncbi:MAG: hypothetical protein ABIK97_00200 [candidate division WOR-3 bacterium]
MKKLFLFFSFFTFFLLHSNESLNVRLKAIWPYVTLYPDIFSLAKVESLMIIGLSGGFWILDISNPSQPQKISEKIHWGKLYDMEVRENFLYTADREKGFRIFDISCLPDIREVARIDDRAYWRILLKDTFALLTQMISTVRPGWYDTIEIFNISNPRNPRRVGKIGLGPGNGIYNFWVKGNWVYLACPSRGGLKVFDISNPENPIFLGGWERERVFPSAVCVKDTVAYVGSIWNDTLFILNVKEPQNIREISRIRVGQVEDPSADVGDIKEFVLAETLMYLAITQNESGCVILNVKNPTQPEIISRVGEEACGLALFSNLLTLRNVKGVCFYDATNPRSPIPLSNFELFGRVLNIKVLNESLVNLGTFHRGHIILDVSQRPLVNLRGKYPQVFTDYTHYPGSSAVRDTLLYTGFAQRKFYILNFANPDSITLVGSCSLPVQYPWEFGCITCALKDTFAFVGGQMSIYSVNIKDPTNPLPLGRLLITWPTDGDVHKVFVQGDFLYTACGPAGFWIIDISDPQRPTYRRHVATEDRSIDIFVRDTLAFLADGFAGFRIFNVRNPDSPREIGRVPGGLNEACGVWVKGSLAFFAFGYYGLRIYDISNPSSPREVGYYRMPESPLTEVEVDEANLIHLGFYDGGYLLVEYYGTGLEEGKGDKLFRVFPNIGKDFRIEGFKKGPIKIYDAQGRLVMKLKGRESSFSLRRKPTGVYFLFSEKDGLRRIVNLK